MRRFLIGAAQQTLLETFLLTTYHFKVKAISAIVKLMLFSFKKQPCNAWTKFVPIMNSTNNNNNNSGSNNHTDNELEHQSQTTQMNVEFVEQQPLVAEDARLGTSVPPTPMMERQMPDETWLAAKQLAKPVVINHFLWNVDAAAGSVISTFRFPEVIANLDSIHTETLRMYAFYKFNWKLRFQLNGTKFHSGQLIVSWDPFSQASTEAGAVYRPFNVVYATGLPNTLLNASANEPTEICIPYVHPRNFLTTNSRQGFDSLGTLRIAVMNPLRAAEGSSQALSITVWLYADSPSVHVPIYRHDLLIPNRETAVPSMDMVSGLLGESGSKLLGDASNAFGNVMTGNFGGLIKNGGSALTGLASMLGLDYPSRPVIEQSHINPMGPMSPGKGVDASYRLGVDPRGGHVATPDQTGSSVNECDQDFIKGVPMLFRQVMWSDARTTSTVLTYFPVTPNICVINDQNVAHNTYLSWLSNAFIFWRGSLTYKFEWISTQFHTGRLLIAFIPNYFEATPTLEQAYSCPNAVVDIQQNSSCNITVPFISPTLYKRTNIAQANPVIDEQVVGYLYVYVLNPLVRPSNVADTIEFNIYVSGGEDFEFSVPRANLMVSYRLPPTENDEAEGAVATMDRMQTRTGASKDDSSISMTLGNPLIPPVNMFGEEFPLLDYIKRYGLIQSQTVALTQNNTFSNFSIFNGPLLYRNPDGTPYTSMPLVGLAAFTPLTTISSLFACWFGSLRYKSSTSANRNTRTVMTLSYNPIGTDASSQDATLVGAGLPLQRTNLAQNNALDVELPCYTPFNLLLTTAQPGQGAIPVDSGTFTTRFDNVIEDDTQRVDVYQAAGDDFRLFYLISPPADFVQTTSLHYGTVLRL